LQVTGARLGLFDPEPLEQLADLPHSLCLARLGPTEICRGLAGALGGVAG
jgi:hypothetical protein